MGDWSLVICNWSLATTHSAFIPEWGLSTPPFLWLKQKRNSYAKLAAESLPNLWGDAPNVANTAQWSKK
jgi:hypothetical protein